MEGQYLYAYKRWFYVGPPYVNVEEHLTTIDDSSSLALPCCICGYIMYIVHNNLCSDFMLKLPTSSTTTFYNLCKWVVMIQRHVLLSVAISIQTACTPWSVFSYFSEPWHQSTSKPRHTPTLTKSHTLIFVINICKYGVMLSYFHKMYVS